MIKIVVNFRYDSSEDEWAIDSCAYSAWNAEQYKTWDALRELNPELKGTKTEAMFSLVPQMEDLIRAHEFMLGRARLNGDIKGPYVIDCDGETVPSDAELLAWWERERAKTKAKKRGAKAPA